MPKKSKEQEVSIMEVFTTSRRWAVKQDDAETEYNIGATKNIAEDQSYIEVQRGDLPGCLVINLGDLQTLQEALTKVGKWFDKQD